MHRPDVRRDLDAFLPRIVPENVAPYRHHDEGPDDMPAHIKSALAQTQLSSPVTDGRFAARHLAGVPIPCVSRADPPGFRIRRAADFSEPPLRYVVVWSVAKETARRTLSYFAGEVVIGGVSFTGGTKRCYGSGGEEMAPSSLCEPMECPDAPAERLEQVPRRPGPR